ETALLAPTEDVRPELGPRARARDERADPFGTVELVRREAEEIDPQRPRIERLEPHALGRVDVEERVGLGNDPRERLEILNRARLVADVHEGDEPGVRAERAPEVAGID